MSRVNLGTNQDRYMNSHPFEQLHLSKLILRAVIEEGYQQPTPVQLASIPEVLAGRDLLATAQTGTGKTAAFALPMLDRLHAKTARSKGSIRALILAPTRELALQVRTSFDTYGRYLPLKTAVVLGGISQHSQVKALRGGPQILVATPGRLLDLMQQNQVRLDHVEMLVLDEADRMLDMGFIHDVRRIVRQISTERQTLLFSATMTGEIVGLAGDMLNNPVRVETTPPSSVSRQIDQKVLFVDQANKGLLLAEILKGKDVQRVLVFTRTKHRADRLMRHLSGHGISTAAIHSNRSQNARQQALLAFEKGKITVLVATDIMARGIDVEGISHVINYELPNDPESYVHRIGRTARAGAAGTALSFCDASEIVMLKGIEKLMRSPLIAVKDHRYYSAAIASLHGSSPISRPAQWRSFSPGGRSRRWR
jgi:ATP-dependent RNA helicase RhlE